MYHHFIKYYYHLSVHFEQVNLKIMFFFISVKKLDFQNVYETFVVKLPVEFNDESLH